MNILNKLTIKHLKMKKKRTIVTIIGVILSTSLMVGIGCLISTFRENSINEVILNSGSQHVIVDNIKYKDFKYIKNNIQVKLASIEYPLGYGYLENSNNLYKPYLYFQAVNDDYFSYLTLKKGKFPKNDSEVVISDHIRENGNVNYKIGDKITIDLGNRVSSDNISLNQFNPLDEEEQIINTIKKEYTVVGIISRPIYEPYSAPGYSVFTKINYSNVDDDALITSSITYKNIKKTHEKTSKILKQIGFKPIKIEKYFGNYDIFSNARYNEELLAFYSQSSFGSLNNTLIRLMIIVLSLISIGCIIVIYNSFIISVMERKKQFGLFVSIGATQKQLRKIVFFEAFIVGIIGIPLGFLCGVLGIYVVLEITNYLLPELFSAPLKLSLYPLFIIIPIIFMILTIILSAYLPAKRASILSPVEAIRLNDDIKINKRKIKVNKITEKIFGIEGVIALKNIKRNKKKYRVTILSLFISIVLFLSFSSFLKYGIKSSNMFFENVGYDISFNSYSNLENDFDNSLKLTKKITSLEKVDDYITLVKNNNFYVDINSIKWTDSMNEYIERYDLKKLFINIVSMDDKSYNEYLKSIKLSNYESLKTNYKAILVNSKIERDYENMKTNEFRYTNLKELKIDINKNMDDDKNIDSINVNVFTTDVLPKLISNFDNLTLIVNENFMHELNKIYNDDPLYGFNSINTYIKSKEHKKLQLEIEDIISNNDVSYHTFLNNIAASNQFEKNLVLVSGMFLYGFVTLVTLIGVSSVFNTINTSLELRRREFAILRSCGLTPKGFTKMLIYESIFYGLKALMYALPVSFLIMLLIYNTIQEVTTFLFIIPYKEILIAIIFVFLITFITMIYSTRKIKKENIIDAIRDENI